ncbi:MAG: MMPL family transporter, partial [Myxococcota bacterium]|nr:MMPL family transporter [Myxococcota bacterium]
GLFSISFGLLTSAAAYILAGGVLNTFSPAFFAVVIVVGTSDLIHLVHRFSDHINDGRVTEAGPGVVDAARAAAREIGFSCLLTTATTAVGFLALAWTDLPSVQLFGLGAGSGVILTYLTTFLIVPPVLARMQPPSAAARRHAADGGRFIQTIGRWVVARRNAMIALFAVLTLAMIVLGSKTSVAYRILADLTGSEAGESQRYMEEHMGAVLPMAIDIRLDRDAREPDAIVAIAGLTEWLRAQPLVGHASSLSDAVAESWSVLTGKPGTWPDSREAAAQSLFLFGMGHDDPVAHLMVDDGSRTRVLLRIKDEGGDAMVALSDRIEREAERRLEPIGATATITGVAHVIQWINRTLTVQFAGSFMIALLMIGAAWMAVTRSVRRVAIALLPNVLPLLAVLAGLGALGVPLKPTTAMVFSIGLGIAVDDTIHFLTAYERHRSRHPEGTASEAVDHAYATAGRSMFDTSLVLIAGLLTLGASEFNGFLMLGGFTAWAVLAALLTDILLLGPLLVALDKR